METSFWLLVCKIPTTIRHDKYLVLTGTKLFGIEKVKSMYFNFKTVMQGQDSWPTKCAILKKQKLQHP